MGNSDHGTTYTRVGGDNGPSRVPQLVLSFRRAAAKRAPPALHTGAEHTMLTRGCVFGWQCDGRLDLGQT